MLDLHTHILPGVDDGSKSVEMSIAMLRAQAAQETEDIVLTPHFYAHRHSPERFLERRQKAMDRLQEAIGDEDSLPRLHLGAEVAYFDGMSRVEGIERLCIADTRCMLVEMPFCKWNRRILDDVFQLKDYLGLQPILAHIERYTRFQPAGIVGELSERGLLIQANASFFVRWPASMKAMHMLKNRCIHFIGSDCHDPVHRPPNLSEAVGSIERKLGEPAVRYLRHMGRLLLEGE